MVEKVVGLVESLVKERTQSWENCWEEVGGELKECFDLRIAGSRWCIEFLKEEDLNSNLLIIELKERIKEISSGSIQAGEEKILLKQFFLDGVNCTINDYLERLRELKRTVNEFAYQLNADGKVIEKANPREVMNN